MSKQGNNVSMQGVESFTHASLPSTDTLAWDSKGAAYQLFALLLSYPDDADFHESLMAYQIWLTAQSLEEHNNLAVEGENDGGGDGRLLVETVATMDTSLLSSLLDVLNHFVQQDEEELALEYVSTFDFNESASLYLTSHELGDSRSRGPAMVALRKLLQRFGYEEATDELPDFLPLILEFMSLLPAAERPLDLEQRMAKVCSEISQYLPANGSYKRVFALMERLLPDVSGEGNPFPFYEKADTDELPYPLMYD